MNGLPGTSCILVDLDGSVEFDASVAPNLTFADDGTLSGFAGCNTYTGSFTLDGSAIDIGPLATTRMACQPPGSDIEAVYLPALDAVGKTWLRAAGCEVCDEATIEVSPLFAVDEHDVARKVQPGTRYEGQVHLKE